MMMMMMMMMMVRKRILLLIHQNLDFVPARETTRAILFESV
jgi:hypothetical protein